MDVIQRKLHRLEQLRQERPILTGVFDYYERLYGFLAGESGDYLTLVADLPLWRSRLAAGQRMLEGDDLQIDSVRLAAFMHRLVARLQELGEAEEGERPLLQRLAENEFIDFAPVVRAAYDRDRQLRGAFATEYRLPLPLVDYVAQLALSFGLQQAGIEELVAQAGTAGWSAGTCPTCGNLPALGEDFPDETDRHLHCPLCNTSWRFERLACVYCGCQDESYLQYFTLADDGYQVHVCLQCQCQLKVTADPERTGRVIDTEIEDLATLQLDLVAQKEGFFRGRGPAREPVAPNPFPFR